MINHDLERASEGEADERGRPWQDLIELALGQRDQNRRVLRARRCVAQPIIAPGCERLRMT